MDHINQQHTQNTDYPICFFNCICNESVLVCRFIITYGCGGLTNHKLHEGKDKKTLFTEHANKKKVLFQLITYGTDL